MYCPKCGTKNQDGAVFCETCGSRLTETKTTKSAPDKKKSSSLPIILIIIGVVIIVGIGIAAYAFYFMPQSNSSTPSITPQVETTAYSNDDFSLNYPKTWTINNSQSDSTGSAVYIIDPQFAADPNGLKVTGVGLFALSKSEGVNQDSIVDDLTNTLTNQVTTQKSTVTVDGVSATLNIVEGDNAQGHKSQYKIINWEKGDMMYIIACVVRGSDLGNTLDSQKANLDTIINSFKSK